MLCGRGTEGLDAALDLKAVHCQGLGLVCQGGEFLDFFQIAEHGHIAQLSGQSTLQRLVHVGVAIQVLHVHADTARLYTREGLQGLLVPFLQKFSCGSRSENNTGQMRGFRREYCRTDIKEMGRRAVGDNEVRLVDLYIVHVGM